jgi:hypothetical protein
MTAQYLELRYSDKTERVPLRRDEKVRDVLLAHGSCIDYAIRSKWWYTPVVWLGLQRSWLGHSANGIRH